MFNHPDTSRIRDETVRPSISLVMPLLNAMPYLHDAINCLDRQGISGLEVIAVDAGSTDGTRKVLEQAEDIKVVDAPGTSQTEALNLGFSMASGEILCWLNGDDILSDGTLGWVADWFSSHPDSQLLYGDSMAINEKGRRYGLRSNVRDGQYQQLLHGDFIVQPSAFWRREAFDEVGPLDESLHFTFDYAFFLEVARQYELHYEQRVFSFERLRGGAKTAQGGGPRAAELSTVMLRHGRDKVPMAFQPEVSATHAQAGIRLVRSGQKEEGLRLLRQATAEGRPVFFTVVHLAASLLAGPKGTAEARLVSNWLRTTARRRTPIFPPSPPVSHSAQKPKQ